MILELDTSNIQEGMIIKNYKELCKLLDLPISSGNTKIMQLREIDRYMDLLKDNNKYIVLEIYDNPIPSNVNSKYTKFIQNILLFYLSKQDNPVMYINKNELIKVLGLVNNKYIEYKKDNSKLLKIPNMDEYNIAEFYKRCDAKILSILESSLKSLKKRVLIDYSDAYKIYYLDADGNYRYKIADIEEHQYILEVKKRVLNSLHLQSEYLVYLNPEIKKEYYRRINLTVEKEMCWEGVFQCYQIIYNQHHVVEALENERFLLNGEVKKAIDTQARRNYNKYDLPDNYLELQKILSDVLIELKNDNVFGSDLNESLLTENFIT